MPFHHFQITHHYFFGGRELYRYSGDGTLTEENIGYVRVYEYEYGFPYWLRRGLDEIGSDITGLIKNDFYGEQVALSDDGRVLAVGYTNTREGRKGKYHIYTLYLQVLLSSMQTIPPPPP